ncbi:hypothetical protein HDU67_004782, partial [Dinochytrium kinnereticum]
MPPAPFMDHPFTPENTSWEGVLVSAMSSRQLEEAIESLADGRPLPRSLVERRSRLLETLSYFDFVPPLVAGVYPFSMVLIDDLLAGVVVPPPAGAGLAAVAADPNAVIASDSSAEDSDASSRHSRASSTSSLSGGEAEIARLAAELAELRRENDRLRLRPRGSSRSSVAGGSESSRKRRRRLRRPSPSSSSSSSRSEGREDVLDLGQRFVPDDIHDP